jgi:hypothetical protein
MGLVETVRLPECVKGRGRGRDSPCHSPDCNVTHIRVCLKAKADSSRSDVDDK